MIIIKIAASTTCCKCNGSKAKCKRCDCVKRNRPCVSCARLRIGNCYNTVSLHQVRQPMTSSNQSSDALVDSPLHSSPFL